MDWRAGPDLSNTAVVSGIRGSAGEVIPGTLRRDLQPSGSTALKLYNSDFGPFFPGLFQIKIIAVEIKHE